MTIHRLQRHGDRSYGKARTLCGLDVGLEEGQIHPLAEAYTDRTDLELDLSEAKCAACEANYAGAVAESRARAGYVTVHALFHGLPLCGYGEGKQPGDWPADQAWLAVTEIGRHKGKDRPRWCEPCLAKAREGNLPAAAAGTTVLDHMRTPAGATIAKAEGDGLLKHPDWWDRPVKNPDDGMRRFEVWSLRTIGNGGVDVRVGRAIENRDGTLSLELPELGVRLKLKPTI